MEENIDMIPQKPVLGLVSKRRARQQNKVARVRKEARKGKSSSVPFKAVTKSARCSALSIEKWPAS